MRILVVGANGTLGKAVVAELGSRHEIIAAGRNSGEKVDISDIKSVRALFKRLGTLDAVICAAGDAHFGMLNTMTPELFDIALRSKVMGQVNLVLAGQESLSDRGSITLTSGTLGRDPILAGTSVSLANGAIDAFVRAAAIELPRGLRVNAVAPTILTESVEVYGAYMRGRRPVAAADVALAFSKSVEGAQTGQIYLVDA
jgi:NAD(P)-dependent dehydrogenase (short-subunit alcohol dehydrogenase family)